MNSRVAAQLRFWWPLVGGILTLSAGCDLGSSRAEPAVSATWPLERPTASPPSWRDSVGESRGWPGIFGPDQNCVSREIDVVTEWPETGPAIRWSRPVGLGYSAPVVRDGTLVLFYREGDEEVIEGASADTGQTQWAFRYPTGYRCSINYSSGPYSTPVLDRDHVYAWGAEGRLHCLDLVSGYQVGSLCLRVLPDESYEELWRGKKEVLDSHYNNLVCLDGYVYGFGTVGGGLRCLELETGRLMWRWKSRLRNAASMAVGERLILFDERGRLASVAISPQAYHPVSLTARGLLPGRCFSAPALSGGLLYVRNEEQVLCLDLRRTGGTFSDRTARPKQREER